MGDTGDLYDPQETTWAGHPDSATRPSPPRRTGPIPETPPEKIGPYVVRDKLGEGGFGQVFLADQTEPVRRKVAIKIIKPDMASDGLILRFEQERQALAVMNHPGVAKVYDGGVTELGQPYFVMEYVDGQPLVKFADAQRMTVRERVELMVQVAEAVHHAHLKGVIHRDLKPGNILARMIDGKPKATVIDFGVAKALNKGEDGFSEDVVTEIGQIIGSRDYMSPEQAGSSTADIDTRSDVYALGVVLYELITGVTPFDRNAMRSASFVELQKIIQLVDPAKPSTRFRDLSHSTIVDPDPRYSPETLAYNRRGDERAVARMLRGELDWICMKCLEKERDRRYDTAGDLAEELQRFLSGEAVVAGPPSGLYKAKKFIRRNKAGVAAAAAALAALVTATGVSAAFALSEAEQRRLADASRENLEVVADFQAEMLSNVNRARMGDSIRTEIRRQIAERLEARNATQNEIDQILSYFEGSMGLVETAALAMTVIQENMLGDAVEAIETRHNADPVLQAALRQTVGDTYLALGGYDEALTQFEAALETRGELLGASHPDTLETVNSIGLLLEATGDLEGALARYEEALDGYRRELGVRNRETLNVMGNLGNVLLALGRPADALPYAQESADGLREVMGDRHPDTLASISNLGIVLLAAGEPAAADAALAEAVEGRREVRGPEHQATLTSVHNRSLVLERLGDYPTAFRYAVAAMDGRRSALGPSHADTMNSILNLGRLYQSTNRSTEALPLLAEAASGFLQMDGHGPEHPQTLTATNLLAACLFQVGRVEEAERMFRDVLSRRRIVLGPDHPATLGTMTSLATLLRSQQRADEALSLLREAVPKYREVLGPAHRDTLSSAFAYAHTLEMVGDMEEAERRYADVVALARGTAERPEHPDLGNMLHRYGYALGFLQRFEEAGPVLEEANGVLVRTRGETHQLTIENTRTLAGFYNAWHGIEPDAGHDADRDRWAGRLEEIREELAPVSAAP